MSVEMNTLYPTFCVIHYIHQLQYTTDCVSFVSILNLCYFIRKKKTRDKL